MNRDPPREGPSLRRSPRSPASNATKEVSVPAPMERLTGFRRFYRWLNLTLVHQGLWPLLVLVAEAPAVAPESTPWRWYAVHLAGPVLAAILALLYLAQRPAALSPEAAGGVDAVAVGAQATDPLREQARLFLLGLPVLVAVVRFVAGPVEPVAKLLLFGLADVAAFQLIHFGVVARAAGATDRAQAQTAAVLLFGASWALRDGLLAGVESGDASVALAATGGLVIGLAVGAMSRLLRRWPGAWWAAAGAHWLVIYLVFGFAG